MVEQREVEEVKCDICGSDKYVPLITANDLQFRLPGAFNVVKCPDCGMVYMTPRPSKQAIMKFYPKDYLPHRPAGDLTGTKKIAQSVWNSYVRLLGGDKKLWSLGYHNKGRILDIGCGNGTYLKALKEEGWETWGIDINPAATEQAKKVCPNVFTGELKEAGYPDGYFDVVTMKWVLEHTHAPSGMIKEVHRILKDNGILLIGVPNIASMEAKAFKKYWYHLDAPRHLYHFSPATIRLLLEKCHFHIDEIKYDASPMGIGGSLYYITGRVLNMSIFNVLSIPFSSAAVVLRSGGLMTILARKAV